MYYHKILLSIIKQRERLFIEVEGKHEETVCWKTGAHIDLNNPELPKLLELAIMQIGLRVIRDTKKFNYKFPFANCEYLAVMCSNTIEEFGENPATYIQVLEKSITHALES